MCCLLSHGWSLSFCLLLPRSQTKIMMKCVLLVLALLGEADGALTLRGAAPLIEDLADAAAGAAAARTHAQSAAAKPVVANFKTLMAGHKDKMDKAMEVAKSRAASQETANAKAVETPRR
jgi:hypothetical protein